MCATNSRRSTVWADPSAIGDCGSVGAALIGLAFGVRPVHASAAAFWAMVGVGAALIVVDLVRLVRPLLSPSPSPENDARPRCAGAAAECWRAYSALCRFIDERTVGRPRGPFASAARIDHWDEETVARYGQQLLPWLVQVFAEALVCGGTSESAWRLVQASSFTQLLELRGVLRDAASLLERIAAARSASLGIPRTG